MIFGGTPRNVVSRLIMEGRDTELYAGMNLPMVIELSTRESLQV